MTDFDIQHALLGSRPQSDEALRFLYRTHFDFLATYIRQNEGTADDAADIFQEVMIVFVNLVRGGKFRGESSIKTFLYALNRNLWLNERKKRNRAKSREAQSGIFLPGTEPEVAQALEFRQSAHTLMQAVEALGESCRTILLQFYFDNRSMKEILNHLPYENEQVVRNKKARCLKKLGETLAALPQYQQLKTALYG